MARVLALVLGTALLLTVGSQSVGTGVARETSTAPPARGDVLLTGPTPATAPTPLTWSGLLPPTEPPREFNDALCYDPLTQQVLYFEGTENASLGFIWSYSSNSWQNVTPTGSVVSADLSDIAAVFDPAIGAVVLFGENNVGTGETWDYQDGLWTELSLTTEPSGLVTAGLVYDAANSSVLLLTSSYSGGADRTNTWSFQGGSWTQVSTVAAPPPWFGTMAFDNATGSHLVVLFVYSYTPVGNDTWTYNNGTWTNVTGSSGPEPPAALSSATYDAADGFVLLLNANSSDHPDADWTWEYVNGSWVAASTPGVVPYVSWGDLTFDGQAGYPLYVGPWISSQTNLPITITWKFDRTALGNPPSPGLSVTPTNLTAGQTVRIETSFVGGYGETTAILVVDGPGCDFRDFGVGSANCTTTGAGQGLVIFSVTDQAGRYAELHAEFNVSGTSKTPAWVWYVVGGIVGVVVAVSAVLVLHRLRTRRKPAAPPATDPPHSGPGLTK